MMLDVYFEATFTMRYDLAAMMIGGLDLML